MRTTFVLDVRDVDDQQHPCPGSRTLLFTTKHRRCSFPSCGTMRSARPRKTLSASEAVLDCSEPICLLTAFAPSCVLSCLASTEALILQCHLDGLRGRVLQRPCCETCSCCLSSLPTQPRVAGASSSGPAHCAAHSRSRIHRMFGRSGPGNSSSVAVHRNIRPSLRPEPTVFPSPIERGGLVHRAAYSTTEQVTGCATKPLHDACARRRSQISRC